QDELALIAHTLALVRLRRTVAADLRRDLPDPLLVDARDQHVILARTAELHVDIVRHLVVDLVAEPELQRQVLALELSAEADAVDLERFGIAVHDTLDLVVDERPREAPHAARTLSILARRHAD